MSNIKRCKERLLKMFLVAEGGDPKTALNYIKYKAKFADMTDKEFIAMVDSGILRFHQVALEREPELVNIKKAMREVLGTSLEERTTIPYLYNDPEIGAPITDKKVMILRLPVIKLIQKVSGENAYASETSKRDKTNQVIGDSKGAAISDGEVAQLISGGYDKTIEELLTFRADNDKAKEEAYMNIAIKGRTNIPETHVEDKVTLGYINQCYLGMGIVTDLEDE